MNNQIIHVRQEHKCGCVPACLAMVSGMTYKEVNDYYKNIDFEKQGIGLGNIVEFFKDFGIDYRILKFPELVCGLVCLACVPSLNNEGVLHQIVLDTRPGNDIKGKNPLVILDPQKGNKGKKYYTNNKLRGWAELIVITKWCDEETLDDISYNAFH